MTKIFYKYLAPYMPFVLMGIIVLFGQAMAELYLPNLMSDIINKGMLQGDTELIYSVGGKMLIVTLASTVCSIAASFLAARLALSLGRDVRNAMFRKVEGYSLHEFDKIGNASLITRTTNDIVQVQQVVAMGFRFIIYAPIMCVGGLVMALSKDKHLALIFVVALPALLIVMVSIARQIIPSFTIMQKKIDQLNLTLRESLTGIRVIRAFNKTDYEKQRFAKANKELMDVSVRVNKIMALMMPLMMFVMNATSLSIIWFGGIRITQNQMDIGNMMAFTQYAMQIMFSVLMVVVMFVMIPRAQASAVRINEVLDMDAEVVDPESPQNPVKGNVKVAFEDVSFYYPGAESSVLNHISFTANAGETTAIIGGTGSGKTTIINLIPRFYDASQGRVLVDGVDVREMSQADLRSKIGFVPQGAILFSGTVSENIRFGKKDATQEEVVHAARIAQAYDFVSAMPEQFETQISQGGTNVSGGQKQRLSIARAVVRRPEIYIFDDSFSALDFKTDAKLRAALKDETRDSAVIVIAQRVSSIMEADKIIVLNEGEIVGVGTHRALLNHCDVYQEICSSQLSEEELA